MLCTYVSITLSYFQGILYSFYFIKLHVVTVHSVPSNTLRDAGKMNLLVQSPRSIVCFANLIYANRINFARYVSGFL